MTPDDIRNWADGMKLSGDTRAPIVYALADVVESAEDHQCSNHGTYICHMCRALDRVEKLKP